MIYEYTEPEVVQNISSRHDMPKKRAISDIEKGSRGQMKSDEELIEETRDKLINMYHSSATKIRESREEMYRTFKVQC